MSAEEPYLARSFSRHPAFSRVFRPGKMTLGFILPVEGYPDGPAPTMRDHARLTKAADELGFAALWARDVPTYDPNFGDVGQIYDPFAYLGFLAANTKRIALATGSAVITLRHPLLLAKQAASIDHLSGGRLLLGVASGDRPIEYPAFGIERDFEQRGERFREAFAMFRAATEDVFPVGAYPRFGVLCGDVDTIPKAFERAIPALVTGRSRQDIEWIAKYSDGWFYYHVSVEHVSAITEMWRQTVSRVTGREGVFKPFAQGSFLDLHSDPNHPVEHIHAGVRVGRHALIAYLYALQERHVHHFAMNLKPLRRTANEAMQELAEFVLPHFPTHDDSDTHVPSDHAILP